MVTVSVHSDVEHPAIAAQYALSLQNWKDGNVLPPFFGSEGQWEDNRKLCASFVYKIHIRLPSDPPWPPGMPMAARKSDNYLVYTRHWCHPDSYQILSIMSPNAHDVAKTSFLAELERRAEQFQNA
ncbi:type II toxin-antitoxin system YafO family toxin [Serratia fonticola]|uniref:type II toxin-antitoxin system YafO family toxin n=1 Tax=Serratia fonticola TaxID=47917 RepID=UPI0015C65E6C|nr:type II toxin-antitoxin system YafO family toxin [Serratia fonticola]NXZ86303.1 type II toxin-antitoxin system YafO family toxin [Serratia fonticola]